MFRFLYGLTLIALTQTAIRGTDRAASWFQAGTQGAGRAALASQAALGPALTRSFTDGVTAGYRIELRVRSEVTGEQPVKIGAKTYVKPFQRVIEYRIRWRVARKVLSVDPEGTAEIEEALDNYHLSATPVKAGDEATEKLARALDAEFHQWAQPRTLRYRETREGRLLGLTSQGVPPLDEQRPRVLSLWLLHALRPSVTLPAAPLRLNEPWTEPRQVSLPNWNGARGSETQEWLAAPDSPEPEARLHVVQQISATVESGPEKPPEGAARASFHGESVNTLALDDGRLLAATRSASRELTWTLAPVEGLSNPPRFQGRLAVEIGIQVCDETPCTDSGGTGLRERP